MLVLILSCTGIKNMRVEENFGKKIAFVLEGQGKPTVVLESGFDEGMETWAVILDSLSQFTQVYTYNRPGYGKSNLKDAPQSIREIAEQLHANLVAKNIDPPYLLVAHSEGALMINMFARLYPEETAAVLMIEPFHPDLYDYLKEEEALIYDILLDYVGDGQRIYEYSIIRNCSEEFRNAPDFPSIPLTVLMAGRHRILESEQLKSKTLEFHEDLKHMSSIGQRFMVENSGHFIHKHDPDLVIAEIRRLMK